MKLTQTQVQRLSQQQLQNVQLLQMSTPELAAYVQELSLSNPLVEPEDISAPTPERRQDDELLAKLRWLDENDRQNRFYQHYEAEELDPLARASTDGGLEETLFRFISRQLQPLDLSDEQQQTIYFLATCLDNDGYLRVPPEELAKAAGVSPEALERDLAVLQSLEPAGVGAKDLSQCLALQLERIRETGPALAIVREHLEALAKHHYRSIASKLGISLEQVMEAARTIRELDPRPGYQFQQPEQVLYILPDVFVEEVKGRFIPYLRRGESPTFHISSYYRDLLTGTDDKEVREYLAAKLHQAEGVLWAIGQRQRTLLRCAQIIADRQSGFFRDGPQALVPLTMADVAAAMDVHESTVSRAVRGKYLQCARGVYPLNYFFSRSATEDGVSAMGGTAARALIRQLIDGEDKAHPLSDQKLCRIMAEKDCPISRRTVAKYRGELGIPSAAGRKA